MGNASPKDQSGEREPSYIIRHWSVLILFFGSLIVWVLAFAFGWLEAKITTAVLTVILNIFAFSFAHFQDHIRSEVKALRDNQTRTHDDIRENIQSAIKTLRADQTSTYDNIRSEIKGLRAELTTAHFVEINDEEEFYLHMLTAVKTETKRINVMRLDQSKPSKSQTPALIEYYETAAKLVRERNIILRRIVRIGNADVLEWVLELIQDLGSRPNFRLRSLQETATTTLSVQIFDAKKLLFIQLNSGDEESDQTRRNLKVWGELMAVAFSEHYDRLWEDATVIKGADIHWDDLRGFGERLLLQAKQQERTEEARRLQLLINKIKDLQEQGVAV